MSADASPAVPIISAPEPAPGASRMLHDADLTRESLAARLRTQSRIDDPTVGWCDPGAFEAGSLVWPDRGWGSIERIGVMETDERDVWEYTFRRSDGEPGEVPVAFVWDKSGPELLTRVYYNKAHFGLTDPRRPVLAPTEFEWPDELHRYFTAVTRGDRALLEAVVHPEAEFHSPIGVVGRDVFVAAFSGDKGGVPLEFTTVTGAAGEYLVEFTSWRRPPHAGLGAYTFRDGMIVGARVYEGPVYR
ncbi:nuclear transport factor 2 family protein [Demequina iriomotensis]|uniref:nuclear transport factor 2 family protein n=1 Tax=Demequina iriomotensis TaxID=1536641 RepID=UPI000782C603|nr:nuclear transport factor 2 family protein [Demequina iriomotensis]